MLFQGQPTVRKWQKKRESQSILSGVKSTYIWRTEVRRVPDQKAELEFFLVVSVQVLEFLKGKWKC